MSNYIAMVGLIAAAAYLAVAALAFNHLRRRRAQGGGADGGRAILAIEDGGLIEGEVTADRMHKLAAICASIGRKVFAENFDFTPESMAQVDRAIIAGWGAESASADVPPMVLLAFGAYVGEVLVRRTRGRWVSGLGADDSATVLLLTPDDDTVNVSPFLLVREKFEHLYKVDLAIAFTALEQKLKELKVA
ncbi:MAG: hypothetical protein JST22_05740 [Bacteroidetes bacterium]|nr:hypothetical protein [Bacteroidota bacterium]